MGCAQALGRQRRWIAVRAVAATARSVPVALQPVRAAPGRPELRRAAAASARGPGRRDLGQASASPAVRTWRSGAPGQLVGPGATLREDHAEARSVGEATSSVVDSFGLIDGVARLTRKSPAVRDVVGSRPGKAEPCGKWPPRRATRNRRRFAPRLTIGFAERHRRVRSGRLSGSVMIVRAMTASFRPRLRQ